MTEQEQQKLEDCLVEDRDTLIDAASFLLQIKRDKMRKRKTARICEILEQAYLGCDQILDDLVEDGFGLQDLPNDYGEVLMIWYGSSIKWSQRQDKQPKKRVGTSSAKPRDHSNKAQVYRAWQDGEKDVDALSTMIDGAVKKTTIKAWLNDWRKDKNLPSIAKNKTSTSLPAEMTQAA